MGMFSEIHASQNAKRLRNMIVEAKLYCDDKVDDFARRFIYPHYTDECAEAFEEADSFEDIQ
jgi:hypothetical protein